MKRALVFLGFGLATGCGPSELEAGQGVLLAAIPITLIGWLLQLGYGRLLRHIYPAMNQSNLASLICAGGTGALLLVSVGLRGSNDLFGWGWFAFVFVGTSYLTFQCALLFVLARAAGGRHFHLSSVLPWVLLGTPALFYAFAGSSEADLQTIIEALWILPGYGGLISGPILFLVFGLAVYQRHLHAKLIADAEPVFPVARVIKGD